MAVLTVGYVSLTSDTVTTLAAWLSLAEKTIVSYGLLFSYTLVLSESQLPQVLYWKSQLVEGVVDSRGLCFSPLLIPLFLLFYWLSYHKRANFSPDAKFVTPIASSYKGPI